MKGMPVAGERFTDENYRYGKGWSVFFFEITLLYLSCFYGIYIVIPLRYGTFCYKSVITREYLLWV